MISALSCTMYAVGVTAGLLLGDAPQQAAAALVAIALGTHTLLRRHQARSPRPAPRPHPPTSAPRQSPPARWRKALSAR
ncbi:MAG TPA: hypothetical protein VER39_12335 [Nocardioidaceae bacterium]|nr:hypothetical protein [Nocardioidaceae bacterium]